MGLASSSDEFCHQSDTIFSGIPGIQKLVDNILVEGRDLEDLEIKLHEVFRHCSTHRFVLSDKKFKVGASVEFAGYIVSSSGVKPSTKCLEAIADFPIPTDVTAVRSFLGLCNQLQHFIPDLSSLTRVLNNLLKKGVTFCWLPDHEVAFNAVMKSLVTTLSLHHFDASLCTRLITDTSCLHGLGYALVQTKSEVDLQPICVLQCGSRSLNSTERNYSTIELECLGIQWALKKCYHFLRGLHDFDILTDQRPLVGLFAKLLNLVDNPRLSRLRETTSSNAFEVKWIPSKTNVIVDTFSRYPSGTAPPLTVASMVLGNASIVNQLKSAAASCPIYCQIRDAFIADKDPHRLPDNHPARQLLTVWVNLSDAGDGLLCINAKQLFVPRSCRPDVLEILHALHPGITQMYPTACNHYYWPGLKNDMSAIIN